VRRGANVALCARDPDEVARAERELARHGTLVLAEVCDASEEQAAQRFMHGVQARFGRIDILITCAATIQVGPIECMTRADFEEALRQIFWTTYHATMAAIPTMRSQRRGNIVHVTSFGGKLAVPHMLPYCSAKFAATGFSAGLRSELAKDGIHVTTIAPGLLRTGAHVNAPFKGQHGKEFTWFSAGAVAPLLSLPSAKAAARIVRAVEKNRAECTFSVPVRAAIIAQAMFPGMMSRLLSLQNWFLPSAQGGTIDARTGQAVMRDNPSPIIQAIEAYGRSNAEQHHAYPGPRAAN
jgi:NAD(P)-dependent dehydrogenase (short-subunit alcohol dehydrogenase family)